jgi:hypothetical protein
VAAEQPVPDRARGPVEQVDRPIEEVAISSIVDMGPSDSDRDDAPPVKFDGGTLTDIGAHGAPMSNDPGAEITAASWARYDGCGDAPDGR